MWKKKVRLKPIFFHIFFHKGVEAVIIGVARVFLLFHIFLHYCYFLLKNLFFLFKKRFYPYLIQKGNGSHD